MRASDPPLEVVAVKMVNALAAGVAVETDAVTKYAPLLAGVKVELSSVKVTAGAGVNPPATSWLLLLDVRNGALAGTAAPFTLTTDAA